MIIIYGEYGQNAKAAQALFATRFAYRQHSGKNTVIRGAYSFVTECSEQTKRKKKEICLVSMLR